MINVPLRWTVGNVHAVSDQQPDALAKSRSCLRFKNERKTVRFYKWVGLYFSCASIYGMYGTWPKKIPKVDEQNSDFHL
jgi:hypothetical protein